MTTVQEYTISTTPSDDDIFTEDGVTFFQHGRVIITASGNPWRLLDQWMEVAGHYPTVWLVWDGGHRKLER